MGFYGVLGQERPQQIILQALANEKLPHAYLFYGEDSVGKKKVAWALVKALNCEAREEQGACGRCGPCSKIEKNQHPDVHFLEPKKSSPTARMSSIKIEPLRELQQRLSFQSYEGRYKAAIIDGADLMNPQAANSFLKTLEEPPERTIFILIASNPHNLLPTIVSRCQGIRFLPLSPGDVRQIIAQQVKQDNLEIGEDELELRALRSGGRIEAALDEDLLRICERRGEFLGLIQNVSFDQMSKIFEWCKVVAKQTDDLPACLREMAHLLRDLAILKSCGETGAIVNADMRRELLAVAENKSLETILRMFQSVTKTLFDLKFNFNVQLALESMLIDFCEAA